MLVDFLQTMVISSILFWSFTALATASQSNTCIDDGYVPKNGYRTPKVEDNLKYYNGSTLHYFCDEGFALNTSTTYRACTDNSGGSLAWSPMDLPVCVEVYHTCFPPEPIANGIFVPDLTIYPRGAIITYHCNDGTLPLGGNKTQICLNTGFWSGTTPYCNKDTTTIVSQMSCPKPHPIDNGYILCCEDVDHSNACCPHNGKAQFECEPGYALDHGLPDVKCWNGEWVSIEHTGPAQYPTCVQVESTTVVVTRANAFQLSDDMIRTVIGVAAGVLSLLLLVIALAFCKPKLKDIKRRWRDMREDENGLIVNGQRVILPSYEEATACTDQLWCDAYNRVGSVPPPLNSFASSLQRDSELTRPPESNLSNDVIIHRDVTDVSLLEDAPGRPPLAFEDSFLSFFDGPSLPSSAASVPSAARVGAESPDSACALLNNHNEPTVPQENNSVPVVTSPQDVVSFESSSVTQQSEGDEQLPVVRDEGDNGNFLSPFLVTGAVSDDRSATTVVLTSPDHLHTDSTSV